MAGPLFGGQRPWAIGWLAAKLPLLRKTKAYPGLAPIREERPLAAKTMGRASPGLRPWQLLG